ncbi:MAG: GyrI-like domain-containing protein [Oscillospiraceae bacterium]|nr:GyrI-like domain-containing protein [Oscillospiraceae bacterium]
MENMRVIHFHNMKMVSSGPITNMEELTEFDNWWSKIDLNDYITPRDFMYEDDEKNCMIWLVAIPRGFTDTGKYEVVDFPGGLYAVSTAKDGNKEDMDNVKNIISQWIKDSGCFEETNERHKMAHVCTPKIFKEKMGYHLTDLFVPIVVK